MRGFSKLMRHVRHPDMDEGGWLPMATICEYLHVTEAEVIEAVVGDTKGRMEYDSIRERVRAKYGHSIGLQRPPWLRHRVDWNENQGILVMHATFWDTWELIKKEGFLRPMNRDTVHFATDLRFGRRRPCVLILDIEKCKEEGLELYWATDHVIVCPHAVPARLLHAHIADTASSDLDV